MGKPKRGKECREEEERSGHGWGGSQSNEYLQLCLVYKCEICVGVKKRSEGAIHPPQKLGNKSQSENKLEGFTKYGAFEVHIKFVYNDNLQPSD